MVGKAGFVFISPKSHKKCRHCHNCSGGSYCFQDSLNAFGTRDPQLREVQVDARAKVLPKRTRRGAWPRSKRRSSPGPSSSCQNHKCNMRFTILCLLCSIPFHIFFIIVLKPIQSSSNNLDEWKKLNSAAVCSVEVCFTPAGGTAEEAD